MQSVTVIAVGKLKDAFFKEAGDEYLKRLKGYCKMQIIEIPQQNLPENPSEGDIRCALDKEAEQILKKVPKGDTVAAMCVEGKLVSSEDLAGIMQKAAMSGSGGITFIIGGSVGLGDKVKQRASLRISASKMTFPHRLFRVMLLEQIYRAYKINAGENYHK